MSPEKRIILALGLVFLGNGTIGYFSIGRDSLIAAFAMRVIATSWAATS
jgi:hypothetical protein